MTDITMPMGTNIPSFIGVKKKKFGKCQNAKPTDDEEHARNNRLGTATRSRSS